MLDIFNNYRSLNGVIDLDKVDIKERLDLKTYGSRPKKWFVYQENLYLFKEEIMPFESIKEIINEELAIQYSIPNVCYDIVKYQGKIGTISKDIKNGKQFVPFLFLFLKNSKISNNLATLCDILEEKIGLEKQDILQMAIVMFQNYLLDIFTAQRDRNVENQGFLLENENYSLAPRYDSANSFLNITAEKKFNRFCTYPRKEVLLEKYKGYRSKFSLCPDTVKLNAIDVLLGLKYQQIENNSGYLKYVLELLDREMAKIYLLNLKEIFIKLKFYNMNLSNAFKKFLECVYESKLKEYEKKEKEYSLLHKL